MKTENLLKKISQLDTSASDGLIIPEPELIALFVRVVRNMNNWKQETLAGFAGVSLSTVERVERGEKVIVESLDSIGEALGYEPGYLTSPRKRRSLEEAAQDLDESYGKLVPVEVSPLTKQNQVRNLAMTQAFLIHRPELDDSFDDEISELWEWLDLASYIVNTPKERLPHDECKGRRRELYKDILQCVKRLENRGVTVLCGIMEAPQEGLPDWKVSIISITPKTSDPGAIKRKVVLVDRRNVDQNWL